MMTPMRKLEKHAKNPSREKHMNQAAPIELGLVDRKKLSLLRKGSWSAQKLRGLGCSHVKDWLVPK